MIQRWRAASQMDWTERARGNTTLTALLAGALSGVVSLLVFLTLHQFWIKPIWDILPAGLVVAILGGLAFGWAYAEIKAGLPPRPWTSLSVLTLVAATLAPAIVLGQLLPPVGDGHAGALPGRAVAALLRILVLLLTAMAVGGLVGGWLGRTRRAALAMALASLIFAVGPGHNIPLLGGTPAVGKGIALLVAIAGVAAVVLVEGQAWLARQRS